MTDKVNEEVQSSYSGTINEVVAEEGDVIAVDELICYIETEDTSKLTTDNELKKDQLKAEHIKQHDEQEIESKQSMKNRYSPAVLSLANEYNINLTEIEGSGLGGRITRKDVKQHIKQIEGSSKDPLPTSQDRKSVV